MTKTTTDSQSSAPRTPDPMQIGHAVLQLILAVTDWSKADGLNRALSRSAAPPLKQDEDGAAHHGFCARSPNAGIEPEMYYDTAAAAAILKVKEKTLACWRGQGSGPAFHKHGRRVLYRGADLAAWSDRRRVQSTSQKFQEGAA